jgi:hypothetical protein
MIPLNEKIQHALAFELGTILNQIENTWHCAGRKPRGTIDTGVYLLDDGRSVATDVPPMRWASVVWNSTIKNCVEALDPDEFERVYCVHQHVEFLDAKMGCFRSVISAKTKPEATQLADAHNQARRTARILWDEVEALKAKVVEDARKAIRMLITVNEADLDSFLRGCPFYLDTKKPAARHEPVVPVVHQGHQTAHVVHHR